MYLIHTRHFPGISQSINIFIGISSPLFLALFFHNIILHFIIYFLIFFYIQFMQPSLTECSAYYFVLLLIYVAYCHQFITYGN